MAILQNAMELQTDRGRAAGRFQNRTEVLQGSESGCWTSSGHWCDKRGSGRTVRWVNMDSQASRQEAGKTRPNADLLPRKRIHPRVYVHANEPVHSRQLLLSALFV